GEIGRVAFNTGIKFRHLVEGEIPCRRADVAGNARRLYGKAIAPKAHGDDAVVVGPYRAILVGVGVVGRTFRREHADAPVGPHVALHQPFYDPPGALRRDNPDQRQWPGFEATVKTFSLSPSRA